MSGKMPSCLVRSAVSALALSCAGSAAYAQEVADDDPRQAERSPREEADQKARGETGAIVVTGTAIRGVAPVGSATITLDREEILNTPIREPSEMIRNLPQASGLGLQEVQGPVGSVPNVSRGSGVNLRGLGSNATLVLIDGHRLTGQGVTDQFADPNQIPFAAIQRVEVVTDGASAIYGSDAVAGVVNYILRKDYEGLEVSGRYTTGGQEGYSASALFGTSWGTGSVMVGGTYDFRDDLPSSVSPFLSEDLRQFGGNDNRLTPSITPGPVGNIIADGVGYGLPMTDGDVPTADELLAQPNMGDSADYTTYLAESERWSALFRVAQDIGDGAEIALTSLYSRRTSSSLLFSSREFTIPSDSPYYIPGLTSTPGAPIILAYNITANQFQDTNNNLDESWNNTLDYNVELFSGWEFTGFSTYGETSGCGACDSRLNPMQANNIFAGGGNAFNPYLLEPQEGFLDLYGFNEQKSSFKLFDTVAKFNGPLFEVGGGAVRLAIGGEYTWQHVELQNTSTDQSPTNDPVVTRDTQGTRNIWSAFAEAFVPVISSVNASPGLQSLDLSVAVRHDDYSDFGSTTNPKVGFTYRPFDFVRLRGSWGTSFRAPTITETNEGIIQVILRQSLTNLTGDPAIPISNPADGTTYVLNRVGNTPGLGPEEATVWSLGADFDPVDRLRLGVTYYNVDYSNRIEFVNLPGVGVFSDPATYALYDHLIVPAPQPDTCVAGDFSTYNPVLREALLSPGVFAPQPTADDCSLGALLYGGQQNLGRVQQEGLDFTASFQFDLAGGVVNLGGTYSKILNLQKQIVQGGGQVDGLDRIGFPAADRARGSIGFALDGLRTNLHVNYVGGYLNDQPIVVGGTRLPVAEVDAWTTLDATIGYDFDGGNSPLLEGLRVNLSIRNLTDEDPPVVLVNNSAFDAANANIFGRIWTLELIKAF